MSLLNYFPTGYNPTSEQSKTITQIQHAFDKSKFVILSAPTGTGKSFFASTLANSSRECDDTLKQHIVDYSAFQVDQYGDSMFGTEIDGLPSHGGTVLTITKALQNQYDDLFDCNILKGKSNYMSTIDSRIDVEMESACIPKKILDKHRLNDNCPYHNDRRDALIGQFSSLNYSMFLSLPPHLRKRQYLICDEASELEDELVARYSCNIKYDLLTRFDIPHKKLLTDDPIKAEQWLVELQEHVTDIKGYLQQQMQKNSRYSPNDQKKYKFVNMLHTSLQTCISNWRTCEYIIEKNVTQVIMTPLYTNALAKNIFNNVDKVLLMSATIIDHQQFCKSLGIDKYEYIETKSQFPSDKSPIFCSGKYPLSKKTLTTYLPKVSNLVNQILDKHKDVKGVIHTHTHDITDRLISYIDTDRLLVREPGTTNEDIITKHQSTDKPTVLVSPSLTYGVDLKDDLARFQIIVKLPYPSLHDKRIKMLFEKDPGWYENKMLNTLVQACGRATRNLNDWSCTYILDGNIVRVLHKCKTKLPEHYISRVM